MPSSNLQLSRAMALESYIVKFAIAGRVCSGAYGEVFCAWQYLLAQLYCCYYLVISLVNSIIVFYLSLINDITICGVS